MCGEFNVRVLKSSLPDLATEKLFAETLAPRFVRTYIDLHRNCNPVVSMTRIGSYMVYFT